MQIPKKDFAQVVLYISLSIWFTLITLVHILLDLGASRTHFRYNYEILSWYGETVIAALFD